MNWHLYKKDDPNTWPEIDCPMDACVYVADGVYMIKIMYYDINANVFYYFDCMERYDVKSDELYYRFITDIPNGYEATKVKKCNCYTNTRCPYEDDGYCFDSPRQTKCKYMVEETEYSINYKRIWEEFKK